MSPELFDPERFGLKGSYPTKEADCYALGMVIYQVLCGRIPYHPYTGPAVILKILDGERPERPQGNEGKLLTDSIWKVVRLCWETQPRNRISAKAVLLRLGEEPSTFQPSSPNVGGDTETVVSDESDVTASDSGAFSSFRPRFILIACGDNGPSQTGNPRGGGVGGRVVHSARETFKATRRLFRF